MKKITCSFLIVFTFIFLLACKKNHTPSNGNNVITTPAPLIDFGSATYRGFQGGLYPGGSNQRPPAHNAAGISIAQSIQPLNTAGTVDVTNGKIVWTSIGMSNATQETQA